MKLWIPYSPPGFIGRRKPSDNNTPEHASTCLNVNSLVDFPDLYKKPHKTTDYHHRVSLIVHNIQENYDRLEDIEEHRPNRKAFQCLATPPELDV